MCFVDEANEVIMQKDRIWPPHQDLINYEVAKCVHTEKTEFAEAFGGTITDRDIYGRQSGMLQHRPDSAIIAVPADLERLGNRLFLPDKLRFPKLVDRRLIVTETSKSPSCFERSSQGTSANIPSAAIHQVPHADPKAYTNDPLKKLSIIANADARYNPDMLAHPSKTQEALPRKFPFFGLRLERNDTGPRMHNPPFILPKDVYPLGYFDRPRIR